MNSQGVRDVNTEQGSTSGRSYISYRSATSSLSETIHPLSATMTVTPVDSDPLLSPPSESSPLGDLRISDASDYSFSEYEVSGIGSPRVPKSIPSGNQYISISVSDPQKEQEMSNSILPGGGTYVTYLITTRTNKREFGGSSFCVRRRFRDVVALSDRLSESFRGFIIPPRPDKNVVESQIMQKQEFVEQRRKALEKYLKKLAAHPVIGLSVEFRMLLQVQGKLPLQPNSFPDGAVRFSKRLMRESASLLSQNEGNIGILKIFKGSNQSTYCVEDDRELSMMNNRENLAKLSKKAESLVKAQQSMGETMGELGLAFIKLTKFENENVLYDSREHASQLKGMAIASIKASRLYRALNSQTTKHLETVDEYLGLFLAVDDAFSHISKALSTLQAVTLELSSLRAKIEKLELDRTSFRKMDELKSDIRIAEDARNSASQEYKQIKENNSKEMERLNREKQADFLNMMKCFVTSQIGYAERAESIWAKVADDTSSI